MPRTIEAVLPPTRTAGAVDALLSHPGVVGLAVQQGGSRRPEGDVVRVRATNDAVPEVLRRLLSDDAGGAATGVVLSEPTAVLTPGRQDRLDGEPNEAAWEEVAALIRRDTNVGANFLMLMAAAGAVAAAGLIADTLHVVVGAMLLAPGFEPLLRMPFGLLAPGRGTGFRSGLAATAAGYAALAAGAAAMALLLRALGAGHGGTLDGLLWVGYWTSPSASGVAVAVVAGIAGAVVVTSRRTLFATGVMIALALVPGIAILGAGLAYGEPGTALRGLGRWATDAVCVLAAAGTVLAVKRAVLHRRRVVD